VVFAQELLPGNVGLASGLVLGFAIGMGGVGATALGWVADHWGLPAVFHIMMLFPVIGLLLSLLLPNREQLARRAKVLNAN
jgi:FSR family fosmidomycin resistance protein-like MFS transporter